MNSEKAILAKVAHAPKRAFFTGRVIPQIVGPASQHQLPILLYIPAWEILKPSGYSASPTGSYLRSSRFSPAILKVTGSSIKML
jgi:hypothetical protein